LDDGVDETAGDVDGHGFVDGVVLGTGVVVGVPAPGF